MQISAEIRSKMGCLDGLFAPLRGGQSSLRRTLPRAPAFLGGAELVAQAARQPTGGPSYELLR